MGWVSKLLGDGYDSRGPNICNTFFFFGLLRKSSERMLSCLLNEYLPLRLACCRQRILSTCLYSDFTSTYDKCDISTKDSIYPVIAIWLNQTVDHYDFFEFRSKEPDTPARHQGNAGSFTELVPSYCPRSGVLSYKRISTNLNVGFWIHQHQFLHKDSGTPTLSSYSTLYSHFVWKNVRHHPALASLGDPIQYLQSQAAKLIWGYNSKHIIHTLIILPTSIAALESRATTNRNDLMLPKDTPHRHTAEYHTNYFQPREVSFLLRRIHQAPPRWDVQSFFVCLLLGPAALE